jgi:hypothetical protein
LSVFLQSAKTDQAARDVMNANYIAQDYIETLDAKTYKQALSSVPTLSQDGDYYLSASIKPYGNAGSLFSSPCVYAHLIMRADDSMLAVMPDGKWLEYSTVPSTISMSVSGGTYSFSAGGSSKSGAASYNNCAIIVSAMEKTGGISPQFSLGSSCKVLIYCLSSEVSLFRVCGCSSTFYKDIITADTSLVRVTASVYDKKSSTKPVATTETYISLRNE